MTTLEIVQAIIVGLPSLLAAIIAFINSLQIQKVHLSLNSRLDQLLASHAENAFRNGQESERKK